MIFEVKSVLLDGFSDTKDLQSTALEVLRPRIIWVTTVLTTANPLPAGVHLSPLGIYPSQ